MGGGRVIDIHSEAEFAAALNAKASFGGATCVVVDFSATWCGPCQAIAPKYAELSEQHPDIKFLKVDVDECREVAASCNVTAMPTFVTFVDGDKLEEMKGANPAGLAAMIGRLAAKASTGAGAGQKLGGEAAAGQPAAGSDDMRAARLRALGQM